MSPVTVPSVKAPPGEHAGVDLSKQAEGGHHRWRKETSQILLSNPVISNSWSRNQQMSLHMEWGRIKNNF